MAKPFVLFQFFALIALGFCILEARAQGITAATVYDDCDKRHKRCFGDTDVCIGFRNCTFAVSIMENRTHFQVLTLNKCDEEAKNYFVGVGLTTWDARGRRECREPTMDDFKGFILWDENKCNIKTFQYYLRGTYRSKANVLRNCEHYVFVNGSTLPYEGPFQLERYLNNHIIESSGDRQPFIFADRAEYFVYDGQFYRSRRQPLKEPEETIFDRQPRPPTSELQIKVGSPSSGFTFSPCSLMVLQLSAALIIIGKLLC